MYMCALAHPGLWSAPIIRCMDIFYNSIVELVSMIVGTGENEKGNKMPCTALSNMQKGLSNVCFLL